MGTVATLDAGWPARSVREGGLPVEPDGPIPGEGALAGDRWFLVWNRDGFGECCCWRGTVRGGEDGAAVAVRGSCQRPGKHPWTVRVDGEAFGFVHGAADALEYGEVMDRFGPPGGARQLAVVLDDLLVIDIDGPRALRDFARLAWTIPKDKILGVSSTPRGFHVWLDVPGWNQKALNKWLGEWLGGWGWHPTSEAGLGRRGFLLDVRTGSNRYVVWPGSHADRRWVDMAGFAAKVKQLRADMLANRLVSLPKEPQRQMDLPPWAVDTAHPGVAEFLERNQGGADISLEGLSFSGEDSELEQTWAELERWLSRLETRGPGTGRNNLLNQIAYHSGSRCIAAGHSVETVRARLIEVGEAVGTHGVRATVESGLGAGMAAIKSAAASAAAKAQG